MTWRRRLSMNVIGGLDGTLHLECMTYVPRSRSASTAGAALLVLLTFAWSIVYTPVALMVGALTRSGIEVLKPWVAARTIQLG